MAISVVAYSACSSLMLVVNKLALKELPFPTVIMGAQLLLCCVIVLFINLLGAASLNNVSLENAKPFARYCSMFAFGIYSNMQVLERSSLGLVIATRSCLPLFVCAVEVLFLGASLPSKVSLCSLLGVVSSTGLYIYFDHHLSDRASDDKMQFMWVSIWIATLTYQVCAKRTSHAVVNS